MRPNKSSEPNLAEIEVSENVFLAKPLLEALCAKHIVLLPLLLVTEHSVGLVYFLETFLRSFVTLVLIGMVFHSQLSIGLFYLLFTGFLVHTKNFVIIFSCHIKYLFLTLWDN